MRAWRNALRISGPSADREANLAEALMGIANGIVTEEAKAAFDRALTHDGKHSKARFFLGVAAYQDGKVDEAAAIWRGMLSDARPDSPWSPMVRQALAEVEKTRQIGRAHV